MKEDKSKAIVDVLSAHPEGLKVADIAKFLKAPISHRTLQRTLKNLTEQRLIEALGQAKARIYKVSHKIGDSSLQTAGTRTPAVPTIDPNLKLSRIAEKAIYKVSAPIQQRKPVGYNRSFLDDYIPNKTSYLSAKEKDLLASISDFGTNVAPAGTYIKTIYDRLLIDLAWNSSRLEGNTYSLIETQRLLMLGERASGKEAREATMIINHREAIDFLVESVKDIGLDLYTICNLHALLANNLLADPGAPGRIRKIGVNIGGSTFIPLDNPHEIKINLSEILKKASVILDPFEQALFLMIHIPYLQPFEDVNKRTSRLALNIPFIKKNLCPVSFVDVPQDLYVKALLAVYELNETDLIKEIFIWSYERSASRYAAIQKSLGEPDHFRVQYRESIRSVISEIIKGVISLKQAPHYIVRWMHDKIPNEDQAKFQGNVEADLMALHEGNFARYRVSPAEFQRWNEKKEI